MAVWLHQLDRLRPQWRPALDPRLRGPPRFPRNLPCAAGGRKCLSRRNLATFRKERPTSRTDGESASSDYQRQNEQSGIARATPRLPLMLWQGQKEALVCRRRRLDYLPDCHAGAICAARATGSRALRMLTPSAIRTANAAVSGVTAMYPIPPVSVPSEMPR